jgi:MscS family membrane protein
MNPSAQNEATPPPWLPAWLQGVWELLAASPILLAATIAGIGVILALLVRGFILFWGLKVTTRTRTDLDERFLRLVAGVVALILGYLAVVAAVQVLPLGATGTTIVTRLLVSVLILQLMRAGLQAIRLGLAGLSGIRERFEIVEERTIPLFDIAFTVMIVGIAAYALLQVWNIDPTAWLASAGVVGIAVGFAARDTLANLFAGFFIIADAPYKVGDYVVLDTGDRGEVTRVGIRSTRLLTRDDVEVIIPNAEMAATKIVNESGGRWLKFRIRVKVGVAYGSDVDQVVELLERVAGEHDGVCRDPEPRVRMRGFGDSSLDFELLCWVNHPSERGFVTHELLMEIYKSLAREGIEIPFPQRDLWVRELPAGEGAEGGKGGEPGTDPGSESQDGNAGPGVESEPSPGRGGTVPSRPGTRPGTRAGDPG